MNKYDLSIILPSIRTELLVQFHESIQHSVDSYSFELIVIGPYPLPDELQDVHNIKYIKDFGSPSRCVQMASMFAEGKYITWSSDDALYTKESLRNCINLLDNSSEKDGIIVRYWEAVDRKGQLPEDSYWTAWTHADQRLPGIPKDYMCCPVGMYNLQYFQKIGGLDCSFHHVNMNAHSLAFRVQNAGGKMMLSPDCVMECDFDNLRNSLHQPLDYAYLRNDKPKFQQMYSSPWNKEHIKIDYDNWKNADVVWSRFK
jgi:hypothetical protein